MSSVPISYDSLKCLMQYMEFDKRIQLFNRCPTIRTAEKSAPLKIKSLVFEDYQIEIDNKNYVIGIYQRSLHGTTPELVQKTNKWGGEKYEVDEYGIMNPTDNSNMSPGDVRIRKEFEEPAIAVERYIAVYQKRVLKWEKGLVCKREGKPDRIADGFSESTIQKQVDVWRAKLLSYQSLRDNGPPLYESFVQLTIESRGGRPLHIERYHKNNKKYHEAIKQLGVVLFGGRRLPVEVTNFRAGANVLRLPLGVKFQIKNLAFKQPVGPTFLSMNSIIDSSSYPLKCLEVGLFFELEDTVHPVVRNAETLRLGNFNHRENFILLQILLKLENKGVHLGQQYLTCQNFKLLVQNWVETGRPVGTHFSIDFPKKYDPMHPMTMIGNEFHVDIKDGVAIIPMSDATQLVIKSCDNASFLFWPIKMEVEAVVEQD